MIFPLYVVLAAVHRLFSLLQDHACIFGAVFAETVVVQQLMDYVWMGDNLYDDKTLEFVAHLFKALSVGSQDFKMFYGNRTAAPAPDGQRMFPFTRSYFDSLGQKVHQMT